MSDIKPANKKDPKVILAAAQENESKVGLLLASPDGQRLMDILEDLYYDGDLVGTDTWDSYRKLGRRDVVCYLRDLRRNAKEK